MRPFQLFSPPISPQDLTHLRNLYRLATVDHVFHRKERKLFRRLSQEMGLKPGKARQIVYSKAMMDFHRPLTAIMSVEWLYDYILMMHADGQVDTLEKNLCRAYIRKMGLDRNRTTSLIQQMEYFKKLGYEKHEVCHKSIKWLAA